MEPRCNNSDRAYNKYSYRAQDIKEYQNKALLGIRKERIDPGQPWQDYLD
ncbi:MAG: hypothetical protein M3Z08_06625 [Chloroflexota bacterium]|nr:hypothetical protein [Chloroflexota bacterium]